MRFQTLVEGLVMRFGPTRLVDGLWVGVCANKGDEHLFRQVEEALSIICRYDPLRYRRIQRDLERVWVCPLFGVWGEYSATFKRCDLDFSFVESSSPELIASVIVHESTHGHYCLRRIGYPEPLRPRIERICMKQQLAFARTIPEAHELCARLERNLLRDPRVWSRDAFKTRHLDGGLETGRHLGFPDWLTKSVQVIGVGNSRLRRLLRRIRGMDKS
jgi:hypothetical protein